MQRAGLDMWLIIGREYNEDPVLETMLPARWLSARRRTMLMIHDPGDGAPLETLAVARYGVGEGFRQAWDPAVEPDQWRRLAALIEARDPQRIGINVSEHFALADGLSHTEHELLAAALPLAVGAFATSAELDRLIGTDARRRLIHDALRGAYLRAVPLLRPFVAHEAPPALACAARVYSVAIDDFAMWDPDTPMTTFVGAAANRSFDLVRTVLRPQFDLVKKARPRPLDVWGDATVRVALHVRRGDVMPVESAARGAGVFPASDFSRLGGF